ncbi:uncharacterized protein DS421_13g442740 [Arachis hypogaea]|nr:uncharacterized protein DS421_13g442740 [Arachis hypogaea]
MAWAWRPLVHSIHLFLLIAIISMVTCWWLWLHKTAYAVSPPSPILWLICVVYILFAIIVFPATIDTMQFLRIPKFTGSVIARAIFLFAVSISFATLIAAAALEPPTVSATATLAAYAIVILFLSVVMISTFHVVPVVEFFVPDQDLVDYVAFTLPAGALLLSIYVTVTGVQFAAASHGVVAATTEQVPDPFEVIACAVMAFCSVIFSMFVAGHLPLPLEYSYRDHRNPIRQTIRSWIHWFNSWSSNIE